jgi:hypothetical protein
VKSVTVNDSSTAQFFADFARIGRLEPFMLRECSLAQAAAQLQISKSLMGYWVKIMLERKLIGVVRVEQRGRHRVPIYAATAHSFVVPMELIPQVSNETWLQHNLTKFEESAQHSLIQVGRKHAQRWQLSCVVVGGTVEVMVLPETNDGAELEPFNRFGQIRLTSLQAAQLHQEMRALFEKYDGRAGSEDDAKSYLIRYLLVEAQLE